MTEDAYQAIRASAVKAAGSITDLSQRAMVYHHLYTDSLGNHTFPLLAAHGALWGSRYFRRGHDFGKLMSYKYALFPGEKENRMRALTAYANAFREINRRVCVETYTSYFYTKSYADNDVSQKFIPPQLLEMLMRCHASAKEERALTSGEKQKLFEAFFLWEQDAIVGPGVEAAHESFDWQCIKYLARKPVVNFSYFPLLKKLPFFDFSNKSERIKKGKKAFVIAEQQGWRKVENALLKYAVLPDDYLAKKGAYQQAALAANC